jgi:hypothetical protein
MFSVRQELNFKVLINEAEVPQGISLGSTLFYIYINKLPSAETVINVTT